MIKIYTIFIGLLFVFTLSKAQTTAIDFTMDDCNGLPYNLFTELNNGKTIILEYFMNCPSCIAAGNQIESMKASLDAEFPGKVDFYMLAYTNSMTCVQIWNFMNTNGFNSVPFDSGAATMAYYGGFMMPTLVVVGGSQHQVIYSNVPAGGLDTTTMGSAIRGFLSSTGIEEENEIAAVRLFPNPSVNSFELEISSNYISDVRIEIVNEAGQVQQEIFHGKMSPGFRKKVDTSSLSNGIYFVRLLYKEKSQNTRFTVLH